ncbi:MAG: DM13 domain-containing protein [Candidatus Sungbacteria bacterium]|nr:DM13 domain-containing protein [Candidatus Sungbacteria bacterium]
MIKIKVITISLVIITTAGVGYWLISPLFINKEVRESIDEIMPLSTAADTAPPDGSAKTDAIKILKSGTFVGADNFHNAAGMAKLLKIGDKYFVRFENDFKVTNGPDLFVYFGKNGRYTANARIGELKGNIGSQNYEVPENIDPSEYNEVWVWCRAFSVPFGSAQLEIADAE